MKILHINVCYITDKFYETFYENLLLKGLEQTIYVPYKKDNYKSEDLDRLKKHKKDIKIIASPIKTLADRVLYHAKIEKYFNDLEKKSNYFEKIDVIHAHSLFSDGGVAYYANKKYNIPFIVAVRTTDTDYYLKYMFFLKPFMKKIFEKASKIVFISPNLQKKVLNIITDAKLKEVIKEKSIIIPNGIDKFWIENNYVKTSNSFPQIKLIQVGRLTKRKNQKLTLLSVSNLLSKNYNVSVDFVGDGEDYKKLKALSRKLKIEDKVKFYGYIEDKNVLLELYRKSDIFVLPSHTETFGISYIEAMSQGLPVIYTKNQGIDEYYKEFEVGCHVNSYSVSELCDGILKIVEKYNEISKTCSRESLKYDWDNIANQYLFIYNEIIFNKIK
ncbi:MAG TPA: glycosyltransferase family 4 protein [Clostridiaceae bacterium]|nr:glycosyltransferase family 4 protein [Clostridiaceae bacterium]